ncbi:MAG: hypothetical protein IT376_18340 [Polyangiaceae bacterium]|nr:hypothetical protein [Polyangiaceae bacterium]
MPNRDPDPATVARADALCDVGRFGAARAALATCSAPPSAWSDPSALVVAARVESHSGSHARARRLGLRAYRLDPTFERAAFVAGLTCVESRGPLAAWLWWRRRPAPHGPYGWWLQAALTTDLRRFDLADAALAAARALDDDPFLLVLRARRLLADDRAEEALAAARDAHAAAPRSATVVLTLAELLHTQLGADAAIELIAPIEPELESPWLCSLLASLWCEVGEGAAALRVSERAAALVVDPGESELRRLAALEADCRRALGDSAGAARAARRAGDPFHDHLAARLDGGEGGPRVSLPVPFRRQHQLACVPACLEMIGAFHELPVDRTEVAEAICYAGTSPHAGRRWALEHGFACREFTVTWAATVALIDRGLPFRLDTVHATSAHARVVCGYDAALRLLLLRDPNANGVVEAIADTLFEHQAPYGPRGMALVPVARAAELAALPLPDAELFDQLDTAARALAAGDREAAGAAVAALRDHAPHHEVTASARGALADFDANVPEVAAVIDERLARFPDNVTFVLQRTSALSSLGEDARHLSELECLATEPGAHPALAEALVLTWSHDHRRRDDARRLARRVGATLGATPSLAAALGEIAWAGGDRRMAMDAYEIAVALDGTQDGFVARYFEIAASLGDTASALDRLRQRAARYLRSSGSPTMRLAATLDRSNAIGEALDWLRRAREARPTDASLACFEAELVARCGRPDDARELLAAARAFVPATMWAQCASFVSELRGDPVGALEHAREAALGAPAHVDAQARVAALVAAHHGEDRARAWLAEACARLPHNAKLRRQLSSYGGGLDPHQATRDLEALLALSSGDAWAWRELALRRAEVGDLAGAREALGAATAISPAHVSTHLVAARLAELAGDPREARARRLEALRAWPDCETAIVALVEGAPSRGQARSVVDLVEALVLERGQGEEGILAWFSSARALLEPEALDRRLAALGEARPDSWAPISCRVELALAREDAAAAVELAARGTAAFPHVPACWRYAAEAARLAGDAEGALRAARHALSLDPGRARSVAFVASLERDAGRLEVALEVVRQGLRQCPRDSELLLDEAALLRDAGQPEAASLVLERALDLAPASDALWSEFVAWHGDRALERARALVEAQPWSPRLALRLAALEATRSCRAALTIVERALEREPSLVEGHDLRAQLLVDLGDHDAAEAACAPAVFGSAPPMELRGRATAIAWHRGDHDAARERLRALVRACPSFLWGRSLLVAWDLAAQDPRQARREARGLVRVWPRVSRSHEATGAALAALGRTRRARAAYARALALDPGNERALEGACGLDLDHGDPQAARATVSRHAARVRPLVRRLLLLRIAVAERLRPLAKAEALAVLADPGCQGDDVSFVVGQLLLLDTPTAVDALEQSLGIADNPGPLGVARGPIAAEWARAVVSSGSVPATTALDHLFEASDSAGRLALAASCEALGKHNATGPVVRLVWRYWGAARSDPDAWSAVSFALTHAGAFGWAALWHLGWRERALAGYAVEHVSLTFLLLGMPDRAAEVCRLALAASRAADRLAYEPTLALHASFLGDTTAARAHLAAAQPESGTGRDLLWQLADTITRASEAPRASRATLVASAFERLDFAFGTPLSGAAPFGGGTRRRGGRVLARIGGPRVWARGYAATALFWGWCALVGWIMLRVFAGHTVSAVVFSLAVLWRNRRVFHVPFARGTL